MISLAAYPFGAVDVRRFRPRKFGMRPGPNFISPSRFLEAMETVRKITVEVPLGCPIRHSNPAAPVSPRLCVTAFS